MRTNFEPSHSVETDRILIVESDEVIRSALQFILRDRGETHAFASLDQALVYVAGQRPDVALLGIGLVENDGERILAEIARRLPGTKILIVANSANTPLAVASLKWGAHDVLGKPIAFDSVLRKVDALLERNETSHDLLGLLPLSAAW